MSLFLSKLTKIKGTKKSPKRIGRGIGSGCGGHTSTKGHKGQKARSGGQIPLFFEGGQMPLVRRLPYLKGFRNVNSKGIAIVNLSDLEKISFKSKIINIETLKKEGLITSKQFCSVKILSKGKLTKKLELEGFLFSRKAKEKIEKVGGTIKTLVDISKSKKVVLK